MSYISALSNDKICVFVDKKDTIINPNSTKQAIALLKEKGAKANITIYDDANHFTVPVLGYQDMDFIDWLVNSG